MVYFKRDGVITTGGGSAPPPVLAVMALSDTEFLTSVDAGESVDIPDPLIITSTNGRSLAGPQISFDYGVEAPWISIGVNNGPDGVTVYFTVNSVLLTPGADYVAVGTVTDAKASNSGLTFTVTAQVQDAVVTFSVNPSSFSPAVQDETVGQSLVFTITVAGSGTPDTPTVDTITGAGAAYLGTPVVTGTGPWTVTIPVDATGGTVGTYAAVIPFVMGNAVVTPQTVSGTIQVTAAPINVLTFDRSLDDSSATLSGNDPAPNSVGMRSTVALQGPQIVSLTYSGGMADFCTPSIGGFGGTTLYTQCSKAGLSSPGFGFARVGVTDPACSGISYYDVAFNVEGSVVQPSLIVSPTGIQLPVPEGSNLAPATLAISNGSSGGLAALGTIQATLNSVVSWLSIAYSNGTVTFTFSTQALTPATYSVGFTISASLAGNSPFVGSVIVTVGAVTGNYIPPEWTLPVQLSFDTATDLLTDAAFVKPAYGDFS